MPRETSRRSQRLAPAVDANMASNEYRQDYSLYENTTTRPLHADNAEEPSDKDKDEDGDGDEDDLDDTTHEPSGSMMSAVPLQLIPVHNASPWVQVPDPNADLGSLNGYLSYPSQHGGTNHHNAHRTVGHRTEQSNNTYFQYTDNRQSHVHHHDEGTGVLREQLQTLQQQNERSRSSAMTWATERERLTNSLNTANASTEAYKAQLKDKDDCIAKLYNDVNSANSSLGVSNGNKQRLQTEMNGKSEKIASLTRELANATISQQAQQAQLAGKEKANEDLAKKLADANYQWGKCHGDIQRLQGDAVKSKETTRKLQDEVTALKSSLAEANKKTEQANAGWNTCHKKWEKFHKPVKDASEEKDRTIDARDARIVELEKERDELEARVARGDRIIEAGNARIVELEEERDGLEARVTRMDTKIAYLGIDNKNLSRTCDELRSEVMMRDTSIATVETNRDAWRNAYEVLQPLHDAWVVRAGEQDAELAARSAQISKLEAEVDRMEEPCEGFCRCCHD